MGESISELNHIWSKVLENLEQKIDDRRFFDVFLSGSKIYSFEGSSMIISAGTSLAVNILSTKFLQDITTAVKEVTGKNVNIDSGKLVT